MTGWDDATVYRNVKTQIVKTWAPWNGDEMPSKPNKRKLMPPGEEWMGDGRKRYRRATTVVKEKPALPDVVVRIEAGPMGLLQIVREDNGRVCARGFTTQERAEKWLASAVKAEVFPSCVVLEATPSSEPEPCG